MFGLKKTSSKPDKINKTADETLWKEQGIVSRTLNIPDIKNNFGARMHAILASKHGDLYRSVLEKAKWTCHRCHIHLPEFMEIDHIDNNHTNNKPSNLACICRYCHDLQHPVWAASRQRYHLILAPDIEQSDLNRLAWSVTMLSSRDYGYQIMDSTHEDPENPSKEKSSAKEMADQAEYVTDLILERRKGLEQILKGTHPEAFWEAIYTDAMLEPRDKMEEIISLLDYLVKTFPTAAIPSIQHEIPPAGRISVWKEGRFTDMTSDLCQLAMGDIIQARRIDSLKKALRKSKEKIAGRA